MRTVSETETVIKKILPYLQRRGYDIQNDLSFEAPIKKTSSFEKGFIDILINCGKNKPLFLIEAKKSSKKLSSKDQKQALEYGKSVGVLFVVLTNGIDIQCFNTHNNLPLKWDGKLTNKIPTKEQLKSVILALKSNKNICDVSLGLDNSLPFRPGLPLKQLNKLIENCHNIIRKIEKNEENAFADFSKFLFLKLLEEKADIEDEFNIPYSYRFYELAEKPENENDQVKTAILSMINNIRDNTDYGSVLNNPLNLSKAQTFKAIVTQLSKVSFHDCNFDTKGAAFEYFVRATLKGKKLGQYFTPRPLIELMIAITGKNKILNTIMSGNDIKIIDPACGTGGFLVFQMQQALSLLLRKYKSNEITKATYDNLAKKIKKNVFYGSDANEGVACAAKMNMIVAGDGHTNIRHEDSLTSSAAIWNVNKPDCDLILTNPPFGTSESESLTESDFEQYPIKTTKGQLLFIQKMIKSLVPDGEICTVIDEGVLNTDTAKDIREWIIKNCEIKAIVNLPEETFKPNKINVKSSLLYLKRYKEEDIEFENNYKIKYIDLKSLGYVGSGEKIRGFDFSKLCDDISSYLLNDEKIEKQENWEAFSINVEEIVKSQFMRLDLKYWRPELIKKIESISESKTGKTIEEINLIETTRGKSPNADLYVDEKDGYALVVKAGTNISKYGTLIETGDYIEKNIYDEIDTIKLQDGDILLASTGDGTLGKCCVYRSDNPAIADGHVTIIRVDQKKIYPEYVADYLRTGFGALQVERLYTGSTGLIELTPDNIKTIIIDLLGDIAIQKKTSNDLRSSENKYQKDIEKANVLLEEAHKKFMMQL